VIPVRVVTFKVEEELLRELDSFARLKGVTRSEVIRKAIELYLKLEDYKIETKPKIVRLTS
jgi:metal-responsive CopG/Arc/MetJ family transcriptional regulator